MLSASVRREQAHYAIERGLSHMNKHMKAQLIHDALNMAIWKRKPPKGVIHHSDRGSQYCSEIYRALQAQHGFVCSMSAAGNCYDNAVMESFYHSLKVELIHGQRYKTREEASKAVFDYVEVFYNRQRLHSSKHLRCSTSLLKVSVRFFEGRSVLRWPLF